MFAPTHRYRIVFPRMFPVPWRRSNGRPTVENLAKYVEKFNDSLKPGGRNEVFGKNACIVGVVKIVRVKDGTVVANYMA